VRFALRYFSYSTRKLRGWQEARAESLRAGLLLLALTLVFFWPQVGQGRILYWGDIGLYFLPMTSFLHDSLRAGRLPLWNPLLLCGAPFVGNPQTWPAYPVSWLLPFMSAGQFLNVTVAFHVWLTALGTFVFLRRAEKLGGRASLVGAVMFAFGGQLVSKEQFPNMVQAIAWLPWILYAISRLTARWRASDAVWLGAALGLQMLAAHAQMTMLTLYLALAYGVRQCLSAPVRPQFRAVAARLGLAGAVALGLCAVQVLPTIELYQSAWRQRLSFHDVNRFYLPASQLGNFVLPALHGQPFAGNFTARGNFWETCCYLSVAGFALALAGIVWAWRGRQDAPMRFWTEVFVAGTWLAAGGWGGLYRAAYAVLPGFRSFHDPARCLLWSAWALSVLAAFGLERCLERVRLPRARAALFALGLLAVFGDLAHFGRTLYPLALPAALARPALFPPADAATFDAHQARVLSPDSARVWQRFTSHQSYEQNAANYGPLWMQTLTPNLPMLFSFPDAFGYEPMTRRDAQMVVGAATDSLRPDATRAAREQGMAWAGMLGVRSVVFFRSRPPSATIAHALPVSILLTLPPLGKKTDSTRVFVCRNTLWQPRARLTTQFIAVPTHADALALLARAAQGGGDVDLGRATIVAGQPGFAPRPQSASVLAPIVLDAPDKVVVQADNAAPALLVLADTLHPGWRASVDGAPAAILSADGFLRAVSLPRAGQHRVVFAYRPTSFLLGLYLTLLCAGFLTSFAALCLTKQKLFFTSRQEFRSPVANSGLE